MIKNFKSTLGYICPICSDITMVEVTPFSLNSDTNGSFTCSSCNRDKECVCITEKGDKYRIQVSCPVCEETHSFVISKNALWSEDIFFCCPNSGIKIFFFGNEKSVINAINENEKELASLLEEFKIEQAEIDLGILYPMLDNLHRLLKDKKISCHCGSYEVSPTLDENMLLLVCADCGAEYPIEVSKETLEFFKDFSGELKL